jgi:uncharacterized protein YkwD
MSGFRIGRGRVVGVAVASLVLAISGTMVLAHAETQPGDPAACLDEREARFLELINDYRRENGVPELAVSKALNQASYLHSKDMADKNYFDHDSQDGRTPDDRMAEQGYEDGTTGENIAAGYPTAEKVFEIWRNSPGHNENMLDEDFAVIGIGLAENDSSEYGEYWTTDFGGEVDAAPDCSGDPGASPTRDA